VAKHFGAWAAGLGLPISAPYLPHLLPASFQLGILPPASYITSCSKRAILSAPALLLTHRRSRSAIRITLPGSIAVVVEICNTGATYRISSAAPSPASRGGSPLDIAVFSENVDAARKRVLPGSREHREAGRSAPPTGRATSPSTHISYWRYHAWRARGALYAMATSYRRGLGAKRLAKTVDA